MPPTTPPQSPMQTPPISTMPQHAQQKKGGAGATVGIIIIVILMLFGALYFWGAYLNAQKSQPTPPVIPPESSTQ